MQESIRVAKPNAIIGVVDSLQKTDDQDFEWALKQFPIDFHEPFYKSYVENSLQELLTKSGVVEVEQHIGFLSKSVVGRLGDSQ